jgi:ribA/ribD-fused uncharacterized protein
VSILEFQGEYRWLSNFWPAQVILGGAIYPSVENAYQAAKRHPSQRAPFRTCTAGQAKRLGRAATLLPAWGQEKVLTMRGLLAQKFSVGSELGNRLLATGDCQIAEGNHWGDTFWGVCRGRGQNVLGRLIMERRDYLRALIPCTPTDAPDAPTSPAPAAP